MRALVFGPLNVAERLGWFAPSTIAYIEPVLAIDGISKVTATAVGRDVCAARS
jgi:hypothetical protein